MRRLVVTPTFAVALGVVVAAVLAFPVTKTVISYGGEPPAGGHRCPVQGCRAVGGDGGGKPALAKPGARLMTPRPASKSRGTVPAGPPVRYQTVRQWQGGFVEEVTISLPHGTALANWRLLLTYRSRAIIDVWPFTWKSEGVHAVLVDSGGFAGKRSGPGEIQVNLEVSGLPGPPTGCSFDGQDCRPG